MSVQVNMAEAKARFSELLARAEAGEDIVIARAGRPDIQLSVLRADLPRPRRVFGALAHLGPLKDPFLFHGPDPEFDQDKQELF